MTLLTTVTLKGRIIASPGDVVTLIAVHGNVLIVANSKGERFAVDIKKVNL